MRKPDLKRPTLFAILLLAGWSLTTPAQRPGAALTGYTKLPAMKPEIQSPAPTKPSFLAQANLPSISPTGTAPATSALPIGTAGPAPVSPGAHRAKIEYIDGLLQVTADNSSLNQILRDIGRQTGMKITGGVTEDRVFGTYGPAPAAQVLTSLLDGTSVNVVILQNSSAGPAELVLTPRQGGPTPPNPNAAPLADMDAERDIPQQPRPPNLPGRFNQSSGYTPVPANSPPAGGIPPSNGGQTGTPVDGGANLGTTPGAFTPAGQTPPDATAQPDPNATTDTSQPQSPNGVSTPQQIYEQLQKLRQQQQQQQQTTPQ
jgi:hypothetical protein